MTSNYLRNPHHIPTTSTYQAPQFYPSTQPAAYSMFSQNRRPNPLVEPVQWGRQPAPAEKDCNRLDLKALMPKGWGENAKSVGDEDDQNWSRYAVTQEGYKQYQSAVAATRIGITDRINTRNVPLRTGIGCFQAPVMPKLSIGPDSVVFNDSSARQELVSNTYRDYYGRG